MIKEYRLINKEVSSFISKSNSYIIKMYQISYQRVYFALYLPDCISLNIKAYHRLYQSVSLNLNSRINVFIKGYFLQYKVVCPSLLSVFLRQFRRIAAFIEEYLLQHKRSFTILIKGYSLLYKGVKCISLLTKEYCRSEPGVPFKKKSS